MDIRSRLENTVPADGTTSQSMGDAGKRDMFCAGPFLNEFQPLYSEDVKTLVVESPKKTSALDPMPM